MTQLQQIEKQFEKLESTRPIVIVWKNLISEGKIIELVYNLKININKDKYDLRAYLGENLFSIIEDFNPVTEIKIKLSELTDMWKQPKSDTKFAEIRKMINDVETLFKIAELSK